MSDDRAISMLREVFGFDRFRAGQEQVVCKLLDGHSALAIFPTGAGKSLCYQLPALLLDGVTLVVSPLIALMKDQIDFLVSRNIPAARLDSTQEWEESRQVFADLNAGRLKLLYVAPERLASERFLQTLKRQNIAMMAIDEAHCISEWGHNFRPDYMRLANLAKQLGVSRVLGLTATATPAVAKSIAAAFGMAEDCVIQTGFYRPNLTMHVTPAMVRERKGLLLDRLRSRPKGPTIVYVTLQRTAEEVAEFLAAGGFKARAYHAGLDAEERHQVQDQFMASDDAIVVATIAFGMGIDKRNIRYVYHYNLPKSLENYAQEIGRAGRDGEPSTCELFASEEDRTVLENFTYGDTPTAEGVSSLLDEVLGLGQVFDVSIYDLSFRHDIRPLVVETALTYLELLGIIEPTGPFYNEYKFQPQRSSKEILAKFDEGRAQFIRNILKHAKMLTKWYVLDINQIAQTIGEPRARIIAAINYLEEQGDLLLQITGARQGFRLKQAPQDMGALKRRISARFLDREKRDTERLEKVIAFAAHEGCRTRFLLSYFGEDLDADCGHCGYCAGDRHNGIPRPEPVLLDGFHEQTIRGLRAERIDALATPRQIARVLCGLNSPKSSRAKLQRREAFGCLADAPFAEVLAFVERVCA